MNEKHFLLIKVVTTIFIVLVLIVLGLNIYVNQSSQPISPEERPDSVLEDFKEVTFTISGEPVTLKDNVATLPTDTDSAAVRIVHYFGNEIEHDIDEDGDLDVVFLITDDGGGSGTFFYVVGAIRDGNNYTGTQALYLGDRISPQSTDAGEGPLVVVNYADRAFDEPMSAQPSIGKSLWIRFDPQTMDFGEVAQNFEGETDGVLSEKKDVLRITSPLPNTQVDNPITVSGEVRGTWYFEASFPLIVVDWDGKIIGQGYATAQGDWMTEEFVPFTGTIAYELPEDIPYRHGALILRKANASDLPEHNDALEIPIVFK